MTHEEIAAMPRELRDAGSEGQTLKDAWETCERSADLIEDLIAQLATERQARARYQDKCEGMAEQAEADQIKIEAQADDLKRLRGALAASDQFIMEHTPDYLFAGAGEELIGLIRAALVQP